MNKYVSFFLLLALFVWSYFARPVYDTLWIAAGRGHDKVVEKLGKTTIGMSYDDVVALNTQSVREMDDTIRNIRKAAERSPEITGLRFSSETDYGLSTAALRERLRKSLLFPPPSALTGNDFSEVQTKLLGDDDLATYTLLLIPAFPGLNAVGVLVLPKKHEAKMPLIVAAHGRGGMPDKPASGKIPVMQDTNRDLARGAVERGWAVYEPIFIFYGKDQPENIRELLTVRA